MAVADISPMTAGKRLVKLMVYLPQSPLPNGRRCSHNLERNIKATGRRTLSREGCDTQTRLIPNTKINHEVSGLEGFNREQAEIPARDLTLAGPAEVKDMRELSQPVPQINAGSFDGDVSYHGA